MVDCRPVTEIFQREGLARVLRDCYGSLLRPHVFVIYSLPNLPPFFINVTPSAEGMSRERCEQFFVSASTKFQLTEEIRVENESTREDHIMDLEQLRYLPARRGRHLELPISR